MRRTVSAERWNQLIRQWRQRQERTNKRQARNTRPTQVGQ
jgi:hypothetical protein